jgi:hypothetical protein
MALLINATGATNGFDADGHYIRTESLFGSCTPYAKVTVFGCSANFIHTGAASDATQLGLARDRPAVAAAVRSIQRTGGSPRSTHAFTSLLHYLLGGAR